MVVMADYKTGYIPPFANNIIALSDGGQGKSIDSGYYEYVENELSWQVEEGKLKLDFSDNTGFAGFIWIDTANDDSNIAGRWGEDVYNALVSAVSEGKISQQVEVQYKPVSREVTKLNEAGGNYQVVVTGKNVERLIMPEELNWDGNHLDYEVTSKQPLTIHHHLTSAFSDMDVEALEGDWAVPLYYEWDERDGTQQNIDLLSITGSTATALISERSFDVTLSDGMLQLVNDSESYRIKPFLQEGKAHLAYVEYTKQGEDTMLTTGLVAKSDESKNSFLDGLVTELPKVQMSHINSSIPSFWSDDKLKFENVYAYQFAEGGELKRGIGPAWQSDDGGFSYLDYFYMGDPNWTWSAENGVVNLYQDNIVRTRSRNWHVLSQDDNGLVLAIEYSYMGRDANFDGVITDGEVSPYIKPRMNMLKLDDLSRWQAQWQKTLEMGPSSENKLKPQTSFMGPYQPSLIKH